MVTAVEGRAINTARTANHLVTSRADELFRAVLDGTLDVRIGNRFPLAHAEAAHDALEGRATTGKVILEIGSQPPTTELGPR